MGIESRTKTLRASARTKEDDVQAITWIETFPGYTARQRRRALRLLGMLPSYWDGTKPRKAEKKEEGEE